MAGGSLERRLRSIVAHREMPAMTPGQRTDGLGAVRADLVRLLPEGGRGRRLVGWGVVAWTTIGVAVLVWGLRSSNCASNRRITDYAVHGLAWPETHSAEVGLS